MSVGTRVATTGDLQELVELYRRFRQDIADERGAAVHLLKEALAEPLESVMGTVVQDDNRLAILGLVDEVPVGMALGRTEELADTSRLAVVEALYVDPPAREVGVGESLLATVLEWASLKQAIGIDIEVLPGMREAKNFLEGSGFAARLLVMHKRLSR
ncbi:MAG: GNAT family N-acetyltransferase [Acidimicrobiales bacterium]|jgi:GNAT superfamily N-acetyltransferase